VTLEEFTDVFAPLAIQLRATDADEATIRVYYAALKDLDLELVQMAAAEFARRPGENQAWFPKTAEWRDAVGRIDAERSERQWQLIQQRRHRGLEPLCRACDDTGWEPSGQGVKRCACRQMRRLEVLGRRPMPSLPSGETGTAS